VHLSLSFNFMRHGSDLSCHGWKHWVLNHVIIESIPNWLFRSVCVLAFWINDAMTIVPSAKVFRDIKDVCCKLLKLRLHVFWRGVARHLWGIISAGLVDQRLITMLPDSLVSCKSTNCHWNDCVEYLAFPILVILLHISVAHCRFLESNLLNGLQVDITDFLVVSDKFCNFLDSVLVKEVRELLQWHRLLLLVKRSNQNRLLNLDNFFL
jgi:hypothetical protein